MVRSREFEGRKQTTFGPDPARLLSTRRFSCSFILDFHDDIISLPPPPSPSLYIILMMPIILMMLEGAARPALSPFVFPLLFLLLLCWYILKLGRFGYWESVNSLLNSIHLYKRPSTYCYYLSLRGGPGLGGALEGRADIKGALEAFLFFFYQWITAAFLQFLIYPFHVFSFCSYAWQRFLEHHQLTLPPFFFGAGGEPSGRGWLVSNPLGFGFRSRKEGMPKLGLTLILARDDFYFILKGHVSLLSRPFYCVYNIFPFKITTLDTYPPTYLYSGHSNAHAHTHTHLYRLV